MRPAKSEPGSYRDREGRVFYVGDEVYRALSQRAWDDWSALRDRPFFVEALDSGEVVGTREADHPVPLPEELTPSPPVGILRHQRIPFVSYPYEWSFGMLQDAALLQLRLLRRALDDGFVLKDSSSYNIQWQGTRPVFIDVASFERHVDGDPWIGYLQFCQLFLYPLLINAYKDIPFQPLLRGALDGIEPELADAIFSLRDRLRSGVLTHVHLQARLQRAHADRQDSVRSEVRRSGFSKQLILNNVRSLEKLVSGLSWDRARSTWSEYGTDHGYSDDDHRAKEDFVRRAAERSAGKLLWDLGCNDGRFTRVAAPSFGYCVALDADVLAVDRLYQRLRSEQETRILPLVGNLVDPAPNLGWRGRERRMLDGRGTPDLILALALVHHLVIGANVPVSELIAWLAGLGSDLVLEFVDKSDPMVKKLLLNKRDHYRDYDQANFEAHLDEHFEVAEVLPLESGTRVLYYARVRTN